MREEYVIRVLRRDRDHPLVETTLIESGTPVSEPRALLGAIQGLAGMLQQLVTPEKVVEFMKKNAAQTKFKKLIEGR